MKNCIKLFLNILFLMSFSFLGVSIAAEKQPESKKSTSFDLSQLDLDGQHLFKNEIVSTVAGDKVLDALLGLRNNFTDRIKRSASK